MIQRETADASPSRSQSAAETRFNISWRSGAYYVDIPNYQGGEVVRAEVADAARDALILAEDVLSRAPFSTGIWPNGMHPQRGIEQIRTALKAFGVEP